VLDKSGYGGLTLEEVARDAGTTKPAIYRRWPTRQQLVLSALGRRYGDATAPDTGCTLCDLDECLIERAHARGDLRDDVDLELMLDLIGSLVHYRALFGHAPTSDREIEDAVEALLQGIASDYPRLREHSRSMSGDPMLHHLHASSSTSLSTWPQRCGQAAGARGLRTRPRGGTEVQGDEGSNPDRGPPSQPRPPTKAATRACPAKGGPAQAAAPPATRVEARRPRRLRRWRLRAQTPRAAARGVREPWRFRAPSTTAAARV
jgi:AcrR family transcriptional regulator